MTPLIDTEDVGWRLKSGLLGFILWAALGSLTFAAEGGLAPSEGYSDEVDSPLSKNLRLAPLSINLGSFSFYLDLSASSDLTLGPVLSYLRATGDPSGVEVSQSSYLWGIQGAWYPNGKKLKTGFSVDPAIALVVNHLEQSGASTDPWSVSIACYGVYHWFWDSGWNVSIGAGLSYFSLASQTRLNSGKLVDTPNYSGLRPALELTFGYALP